MTGTRRRLQGLLAALVLAGAAAPVFAADPAPAQPAAAAAKRPGPAPECMAVLEELSRDIPMKESGPQLRSMGLRIRTPIIVPDGVLTERNVVSGARLRVMIDSRGQVVPGSVVVQRATGDPKLPLALSQVVPATLSFDVSGAFTVPDTFAFTTVYVSCASAG